MPRAKCRTCGAKLPAKGNFCPQCGTAVESGDTVVQELPPTDPPDVPVQPAVAQRRLFGVTPPTVLLGLAVIGILGAIALFATGHWPWGLVVLGLALFALTGFLAEARRLPGESSEVARVSLGAVRSVQARAGAAYETVAAHGTARLDLARLRREADRLRSERSVRMRELGEAVYAENDEAAKESKERIRELDAEIDEKEAMMAKVTMDAMERINRAKLQVEPTRIMPAGTELPDEAPEPARVPEPFPPPDEGDRPKPPEIPEPGPNPGGE